MKNDPRAMAAERLEAARNAVQQSRDTLRPENGGQDAMAFAVTAQAEAQIAIAAAVSELASAVRGDL